MHWILSKNLQSDSAFPTLLTQLERQGTPFTMVGTIPFSGDVVEIEGETPLESITGSVFCCGKGSMKHLARKYGWTPGYIEAADYVQCLDGWGDQMLNADALVGNLGKVKPNLNRFFLRPNNDDKSFNGQVMNIDEFSDWERSVLSIAASGYSTITSDSRIIISPLKEIYAEYRFYVVNGKVVTGSLYKNRDVVVYVECIDREVIDYAQAMVDMFQPSIAFVLDIAVTPNGLRVLETNSISSSGFYAIDLGKFVHAINELDG